MKIEQRLKKLEMAARARLGFKVLTQAWDDPDLFFESPAGNVDYRFGLNGQYDKDKCITYSCAQVAELRRSGWEIITVEFVDDWRSHEVETKGGFAQLWQ